MTKTIEILSTKDYNLFKLITGNRPVNMNHVRQLMVSMTEEECVSPIQVNEKMGVIDGQHRLTALKELKKPVYYYIVKGAGLRTVQKLNSYTKNWTTDDYMKSYIEAGKNDYKVYKEFKDTYKFGNSVNILLLTSNWDRNAEEIKFKNGEFKIKDINAACDIASKMEKMSKFIDWYKERSFCHAMYKAIKTKGFNYDMWLHKCELQQRALVKCANTSQYLEMIEEMYNHKTRKENRLIIRDAK